MIQRSRARRTVYVHCGLHKTGTSAIQAAFHQNRPRLREHGLLYPATGDEHPGHHNLAWEIAGDRRFNPAALTIADAVAQAADFDGDALLSSEDFESFLDRPQALAPLVQPLRAAGRQVTLVVYFRGRRSYAHSLYAQLLRHGYAATFDEFSAEIRANGTLRYQEWVFQFAYRRVRAALAAYHDVRLVQRRYEAAARSGSVLVDLLPLLGLPAGFVAEPAREFRNEREATAVTLARFVANRGDRAATEPEHETIDRLLRESETLGMPPLARLYSAATATAIAALAAAPSAQAERALLTRWGLAARWSWALRWASLRHWWA